MRLNSLTENIVNLLLYFFVLNIVYAAAFAIYFERRGTTYVSGSAYEAAAAENYAHSFGGVKIEKVSASEKPLQVGQYFEYGLTRGNHKVAFKYEVLQEYERGFLIKGTANRLEAPRIIEEEFMVDKVTWRTTSVGYTSMVWNEYISI